MFAFKRSSAAVLWQRVAAFRAIVLARRERLAERPRVPEPRGEPSAVADGDKAYRGAWEDLSLLARNPRRDARRGSKRRAAGRA